MAKYAEGTKVDIPTSRGNIERLMRRYGASGFAYGDRDGQEFMAFEVDADNGRLQVKFTIRTPDNEREHRRLWRCLELLVKSKLEVVAPGIAEFTEEFLPYIVVGDSGMVVKDLVLPMIDEGQLPRLLPPPNG